MSLAGLHRIVGLRRIVSVRPGYKSFGTRYHRGWESRLGLGVFCRVRRTFTESDSLGMLS